MKFISESQDLIVWDAEQSKELCRFKNGQFVTDDERTIEILLKNGYENDGETEQRNTKGQEVEEESIESLRKEAKEKGIKGYHSMKEETLIERLKG